MATQNMGMDILARGKWNSRCKRIETTSVRYESGCACTRKSDRSFYTFFSHKTKRNRMVYCK